MKKIVSIAIIFLCLFLMSCSEEDGIASDNIKLSTSKLQLDSKSGSHTIITQSDFWWVISVKEDGKWVDYGKQKEREFDFEGSWYSIKREKRNLIISVDENTTPKNRQLYIGLQAGNWFGSSITVDQQAGE